MKKILVFIALAASILFTTCCKQDISPDATIYVGGYIREDLNMPLHLFIKTEKDSLSLMHNSEEVYLKDFASVYDDTILFFDQKSILVHRPDKIIISPVDTRPGLMTGYHFFKARSTPDLTSERIRKVLAQTSFDTKIPKNKSPNRDLEIKKSLQFSTDSLKTVYEYYYQNILVYSEYQQNEYQVLKQGNHFFLVENPNAELSQRPRQIIDITSGSFSLLSYQESVPLTEKYKSAKNPPNSIELTTFYTCYDSRPGEYYHNDIKYVHGNEYLLEKISKDAPTDAGNGYITIHFIINCEGKVGNIGLEQMDRSYKSASFGTALVKHLIDKVVSLDMWPPIPEDSFYRDVHAFLMFKIENGKITDLCP